MKFVAPKKALVESLNKVVGCADPKSTLPILGNVLVEADSGAGIRFSASNLYQTVSCSLDFKPESSGAVALPAKDLIERVKALPDGDVEMSVDLSCQANIRSVGSARRYTLSGMPSAEFPQLPRRNDTAQRLSWTAGDLRTLIARVHFAVSTDETRSHINSLLLHADGKTLRLVATDGHRLAMAEMGWQHPVCHTVLLPLKAVHELRRLLAEDGPADTVEMSIEGPTAFFSVAGVEYSTKTTDAQFPPYDQVIPAKPQIVATVARSTLIDAAKAVAVAANDKTGGLRLDFADGKLRISAKSAQNGDGSDEIAVDYSGDAAFFGVNAKYLTDALGGLQDDEATIAFDGELAPIKITDTSSKSTQVCMPMRLD